MRRTLLWGLVLCLSAPACWAHPYHRSLAKVAVNRDRGVLEVALGVLPEQLETALAKPGEVVNLEGTADIERRVLEYLWQTFRVTRVGDDSKHRLELVWLGMEITYKNAWLYFEVDLAGVDRVGLKNAVLNNVGHSQQINTVLISKGSDTQRMTFTEDTPVQEIAL